MTDIVYLDVNLNSSEAITAGPRPLTRQVVRSVPIINNQNEYDVCVVRMVLNSALLPIWIPQLKSIQPQKEAPNATVYQVGLTCRIYDQISGQVQQTIQTSAPVIYQPTRPITPPQGTPIGGGYVKIEQPKSPYCHVYDIGQIIQMFNRALMVAYIPLFQQLNQTQWALDHPTLMQQLENPYFSYDFNMQNLKLNAKPYICFQDITETGVVSLPYMEITISFSAECFNLLQGFYCRYNNLNTSVSTPFDIDIIPIGNQNLQRGLYLTQAGTVSVGPQYTQGPPYNFEGSSSNIVYSESENVPSIAIWQQTFSGAIWSNLTAVQSIVLLSDLSIRPENIDNPNLSGNSTSLSMPLLTDFFGDNQQPGNLTSPIIYNTPTLESGRKINLQSTGPLTQFTISAYWLDFAGNQFPLYATDFSRPSTIKLAFIKKKLQ